MLQSYDLRAATILTTLLVFNGIQLSYASDKNIGLTPSASSLRALGANNQVIIIFFTQDHSCVCQLHVWRRRIPPQICPSSRARITASLYAILMRTQGLPRSRSGGSVTRLQRSRSDSTLTMLQRQVPPHPSLRNRAPVCDILPIHPYLVRASRACAPRGKCAHGSGAHWRAAAPICVHFAPRLACARASFVCAGHCADTRLCAAA